MTSAFPRAADWKAAKAMFTEDNPAPFGYNSFGVPIYPDVFWLAERNEIERVSVIDWIKTKFDCDAGGDDAWKKKQFAYVMMRPICVPDLTDYSQYIPREYAIVVFSFEEGVVAKYSGLFEAGELLPRHQQKEIKEHCEIFGLPRPDYDFTQYTEVMPNRTSVREFLDLLSTVVTKHQLIVGNEVLLFVEWHEQQTVDRCFNWIKASFDLPFQLKVARFGFLVMEMSQKAGKIPGVCYTLGGAAKFILDSRFEMCELACPWHLGDKEAMDKMNYCSLGNALTRVYNVLYYLGHLFQVDLKFPTHIPIDLSQGSTVNIQQPSEGLKNAMERRGKRN